jgi:transposase InsO family protein
MYWW